MRRWPGAGPLSRRRGLLAGPVLGVALPAAQAADTAPGELQRAVQRDRLVLPVDLPGGLRLREASGLAWDAAQGRWWSVGDRGVLVAWTVSFDGGRLQAQAQSAQRIAARLDAESLDVVPLGRPGLPGGLAVLDEATAQVLRLDANAQVLATRPLPGEPADHRGGVEALAWHPAHGLVVVPQRGAADGHRLLAEDGRRWTLPAGGAGRVSIKAAHVTAAGRLLLLEKIDPPGTPPRWVLREVDFAACTPAGRCEAAVVAVPTEGLQRDDNLEGLACRDDGHCLLISDDGRLSAPRTVLLWLALQRGAR